MQNLFIYDKSKKEKEKNSYINISKIGFRNVLTSLINKKKNNILGYRAVINLTFASIKYFFLLL